VIAGEKMGFPVSTFSPSGFMSAGQSFTPDELKRGSAEFTPLYPAFLFAWHQNSLKLKNSFVILHSDQRCQCSGGFSKS
jgi:hypothetical protein